MNRRYLFWAALIAGGLLSAYFAMQPDPVRQANEGSRADPSSGLVFSTKYPVTEREWPSPHEIAQPDGSRAIVLHEESDWRLLRHWPSGYLDVAYRMGAKDWARIPLGLAWRRSQIPLLAFASSDRTSFYLVTYDAVTNIPSGRSLKPSREGLDLYRITPDSQEEPEHIASALPLGGFDTRLFAKQWGTAITLCGGNRCLKIDSKGAVQPWALEAIANHEIIELVFSESDKAYALTRLQHDDRQHGKISEQYAAHEVFALSSGGSQLLGTVSDGGVPWGLTIEDGQPVLRMAANAQDLRALLQYELSLMPFSGVMDYGSNNLEGRVAWSSVYYLNGLISLTAQQKWLPAIDREALGERLTRELELIARLGQTAYPNYFSKRYSIDREPMLVALHVGRALQLLSRAMRLGISSQELVQARNTMCYTLSKLESTLEETRTIPDGAPSFFYRKGFPFWADGANVPYNYVSGVIAGRLEAGCITASEAGQYLRPILSNEFESGLPEQWRYWWGEGDNGWTEIDQISLNTPVFKGNGGAYAHISYRTMDIEALLLYGQLGGELPAGFNYHVERLTTLGSLYPLVNELLVRLLGTPVHFDDLAARRYARAIAPWEVQNQVWALAFLSARKTKD